MVKPTPIRSRRRYTKAEKVTAVMAAEMTTTRAAAKALGVNESTVRYWFDDPDFAQYRAKTREDIAPEAIAIIHEALAMVRRKLDQFDPRDLTVLIGVLTDKAQLLAGEPTVRTELTQGLPDEQRTKLRSTLLRVVEEVG